MNERRVLAAILVAIAPISQADTRSSIVAPQSVAATQTLPVSELAAQWGLTTGEWLSYREIMRDRRGVWSPGLDPITALGVSADTAAERKRYAELYVRSEFERTRKELAFQLAVDRAWARLYPDTPRLQTRDIAQGPTSATVRYALVVSTDCADCEAAIAQRLSRLLARAEEGIDIHVVGTGDSDAALREWIDQQPAILAALKAGRVTVNHGHSFEDLGAFPVLYAKAENGQWSREL